MLNYFSQCRSSQRYGHARIAIAAGLFLLKIVWKLGLQLRDSFIFVYLGTWVMPPLICRVYVQRKKIYEGRLIGEAIFLALKRITIILNFRDTIVHYHVPRSVIQSHA